MAHHCSECTYLDINSGDYNGNFWCEKKLERHNANDVECWDFCQAYSRSYSTSKSAEEFSNDKTKSGCYLTTMLCNILEMDDTNIYLNTLRNFRNNYLQKNEKYKFLLIEYDIIGPIISNNLNNDPLKKIIANKYFNKYIIPITEYINSNENEKAIELYQKMVNILKYFYRINNITLSIDDMNDVDITKSGHGTLYTKTKLL